MRITHFLTVGRFGADRSVVSLEGHQTCPHCRAIVQSTICSICGRSSFEEVAPSAERPKQKWNEAFENNELRKLGVGVLVVALLVGAVAFVVTRPESTPSANELPPPASTTRRPPEPTSSEPAPSVVGGVKPTSGFFPGAPREVGEGLSPWETPPAVDFVSGLLLDESLDYSADIDRVAELLDDFPNVLTLNALNPPEILTFGGSVDAEQLETTQPFAARTISRDDGLAVGQLWLIASGGTDAGDAYLAAARDRWDVDAAIDQYSPEVGVRLWLLGTDSTINLWASDLEADSMVLVQAPTTADPGVLTDALRAWRRAA